MPHTRRDWLQAAAIGACAGHAGLRVVRAASDTTAPAALPPIRSCILIFHYGGPSQLESFDPKPHAPAEVRGEYGTMATSAPGVFISDRWQQTAAVMHRAALVRSVHHPMRNHNSAAAEVLTGRTPAGGDQELLADEARSYPTLGSVVSYGLGARAHVLPYVALPYTMYNVVQLPGQTPGFLGGAYDRLQVDGDPNAANFQMSALQPPPRTDPRAWEQRSALLRQLEAPLHAPRAARLGLEQQRALDLVSSEEVRRGFDLDREDPATRDRYGRHLLGQSTLLARRLVESGVNFVSVFDGQRNGQDVNWDSHVNLFPRHGQLIPPADQSLAALIEDLAERGLLDSTLVISMAEFGRTPKINGSAGRDHWPDCYTVLLAGGGAAGGAVYGASDASAAYPDRNPVTPADLVATLLWRFGIDWQREVHDQTNRPYRLCDGQPLAALFGASQPGIAGAHS